MKQFTIKSDETTLVATGLADGGVELYTSKPIDEATVDSFDTWFTVEKEDRPALALAILGEPEDVEKQHVDSPEVIADYTWSNEILLVAARHFLKAYALRFERAAAAEAQLQKDKERMRLNQLASNYFGKNYYNELSALAQGAIGQMYVLEQQVAQLQK